MELLEPYFFLSIAAPRKSGKSYLVTSLLRNGLMKDYDHIIIMCPTIEFNDDYVEFEKLKDVTLISNVTKSIISELVLKQEECQRKTTLSKRKRDYKEDENEEICPNTLLILDDCIDTGVMNFKGVIDQIAERGRHIKMSAIVISQRISAISRSVRLNSDAFIIFSPFSIAELEQFVDQFVPKLRRKEARIKIHTLFETQYNFLILDNSMKGIEKLQTSQTKDFLKGKMTPLLQPIAGEDIEYTGKNKKN
tara:strand:- start:1122 stop:1871 length:750 start_codon:yes stop_codon:yes gene_type:complete